MPDDQDKQPATKAPAPEASRSDDQRHAVGVSASDVLGRNDPHAALKRQMLGPSRGRASEVAKSASQQSSASLQSTVKAMAERLDPAELAKAAELARGPSPEMTKAMEGVLAGVKPKPSTSPNDTFVGRFLPLLGGAFLTVPPSVSVAVALKSEHPNWYLVGACILACWTIAAVLVAAGLTWPKWKPNHEVLAGKIVTLSNSKPAWLLLLLLVAVVPAASVGWLVRNKAEGYTQAQLDTAVSEAKAPLQSQLTEAIKQRDARADELASVRRDLANARQGGSQSSSPAGQPVPSTTSGPMDWSLNGQLIVGSGGGPTAAVNGLIFQGQSLMPFRFREAYVISGLTGHTEQLKAAVHSVGKELPVTDVDVPTDAPVQLDLTFEPALTVRDFFDQWGKFRLVISYENGSSFQHDFEEDLVRQKVQQVLPNSLGPHVTPRQTSK